MGQAKTCRGIIIDMSSKKRVNFRILFWPLLILMVFAALLFVERSGMQYSLSISEMDFLSAEVIVDETPVLENECLLLYDSQNKVNYHENIEFVLSSMRVEYQLVDVSGKDDIPAWNQFKTVVVALTNLDNMQDHIVSLLDWAEEGGSVLFAEIPEPNGTLKEVYDELGMLDHPITYIVTDGIRLKTDLFPGSTDTEYHWSNSESIALSVQITDDCTVHMVSADDTEVPMLWERDYGSGKIVVNNSDFSIERGGRGYLSAEYSLLYDVFAYPVINASVVFIDDFPGPIQDGYNDVIYEQYQCDTEYFYTDIWFPNMIELSYDFGLKYTCMFIETYSDSVDPPFEPLDSTDDYFSYFGSILLDKGHEIGLHGYNHMSLVLEDFDYKGLLDYTKWKSVEDMAASIAETVRYQKELFPNVTMKTYVSPSNVLSAEGRAMLVENFPEINTIAGVYIDNSYDQYQEFEVGEDGIIDLPRISSGFTTTDDDQWIVMNELTLHFVSSHFIHPDDVIDEERNLGNTWEELYESFEEYLDWLYDAADGIRNLTVQDAAKATQRYCNLSVERSMQDNKLILDISGFYDEAWLLARFNDGEPGFVQGGSIEHVSENLYLLQATDDHVVVTIEG